MSKNFQPTPPTFNKPAYVTEKEVATRLGMSVRTIQNWRAAGEGIPSSKFKGAVRYAVADVLEFEAAARRPDPSGL